MVGFLNKMNMEEYEFYRYLNGTSILVITPLKQLKRIYCPFYVMDINKKIMKVDSVGSGRDNKIFYMINAVLYPIKNLKIITSIS